MGGACSKRDDEDGPIPLSVKPPTTTVITQNPIVKVPEVTNELKEFQPEVKMDDKKIRLRKEIRSLSKEELIEVQWAFHLLQNTNDDDGVNLFFKLARIHTLHCQHWQYSFLPWHRRYIDQFEEELRRVYFDNVGKDEDNSVSLPFWSWCSIEDNLTDQFDIPKVFFEDEFERNGQKYPNPLKSFTFSKREVAPPSRADRESDEKRPSIIVPDKDIKYKLENTVLPELVETMKNEVAYMNEQGIGRIKNMEWTQFNGKTFKYLETGFAYHLEITAGHNSIHMLCNGDMGHPWYAAFCPIFWFHHNNIERLWRIWQDRHVAMRHPDEFQNKETSLLPGLKPRPGVNSDAAYCYDELKGKEDYHFEHQPREWNLFFGPEPKSAAQQSRHRLCWTDLQLYDSPYSFHVYLYKGNEEVPKDYPGVPNARYLTTVHCFQRPCLCSDKQKQLKLTLPSYVDVSHQVRQIYGEVNEVPNDAKLIVYPMDLEGKRPDKFIVKNGTVPFMISKPFIASLSADRALKMAPTFRRNIQTNTESKEIAHPGWNVKQLHQKYKQAGKNIRVAIIDTGIDAQLKDILNISNDCMKDFTYSDNDDQFRMIDSDGHGTFSASIVASIANNCNLYIAKSITSGVGSWKPVIKAIRWAIEEGCHVICLALGSDYSHAPLSDAVHEAIAQGIICIAAAGNDEDGIDYPAKYGSVISIGAHDNKLQPAPVSSTGPELDFLCPGKDIEGYHFGNTLISMTGSSVACAHAAGLAALILGEENKTTYEFGARSKRRIKNANDLKQVFKAFCQRDSSFSELIGHGAIVPV